MVGGTHEPHDQGAGNCRRIGRARAIGGRGDHAERDAPVHEPAVRFGPRRSLARRQKRKSLERFKSVYSIFISRIDVYTKQHVPDLSPAAQGLVGIVNAKRLWQENHEFWKDKKLPLAQEFIFASTGTKDKADPPDKYVSALAGSDIQTNPPATNAAIQAMPNKRFTRTVDQLPAKAVLDEVDKKVDFKKLETVLMDEGTKKFADPHKKLLALIAQKRTSLAPTGR